MRTLLPRENFSIPASYNFINPGSTSLHYGIPWIAPAAVLFLNDYLSDPVGLVALDFGSGGSTIFYGARCERVTAIEMEQPGWVKLVREALLEQELTNVDLISTDGLAGALAKVSELADASFDVISIDSMKRQECLQASIKKLKPRGILVLDNYADSNAFAETASFSYEKLLKVYNLPNHSVRDFNQPGWVGIGTRIVYPS